MADQDSRQDFFVVLPSDPMGADDPLIVEAYPEHFQIIGFFIAGWSELEYKLMAFLAVELQIPLKIVTAMMYAIESSGARLDVMRAVFGQAPDSPVKTEYLDFLTEAGSILTQRNKFAHAIYAEGHNYELAILGMRRDSASDLPVHDLKHQLGRLKNLSYRVGRNLAIRAGIFSEQPTEQHASDVQRKLESMKADARSHPSPRPPQKPSQG